MSLSDLDDDDDDERGQESGDEDEDDEEEYFSPEEDLYEELFYRGYFVDESEGQSDENDGDERRLWDDEPEDRDESDDERDEDEYDEDDSIIDTRSETEILAECMDYDDTDDSLPYHTRENNYYDQLDSSTDYGNYEDDSEGNEDREEDEDDADVDDGDNDNDDDEDDDADSDDEEDEEVPRRSARLNRRNSDESDNTVRRIVAQSAPLRRSARLRLHQIVSTDEE